MKKRYKARWHGTTTGRVVASVDIMARSDFDARQQADALERKELNVANCTRTIYEGQREI